MSTISKPVLPPLQTPKSASFPSEIVSTPLSAHPLSAFIKQEQDLHTPITPPTAYTDFLKALTPILASPPPTAMGRSMSDDSTGSAKESHTSNHSAKSSFSSQSGGDKHFSTMSLPPPTPLSALSPNGARSAANGALKRLRIPQYSPVFSPNSSARSPRTATMSAASMMYSPFSPAEWTGRSNFDHITTPRSACSKPVSVRSVVTRTVTYKRTNLEPAPKGKRRKTHSATASVTSDEETSTAQEVKDVKPKLEKIEETTEDTKQQMPPPPTIALSPATTADDTSSISSGSSMSSDSD